LQNISLAQICKVVSIIIASMCGNFCLAAVDNINKVDLNTLRINPPNILLLNSYHPQYAWTEKLTQGVQDALSAEISIENLRIEYMDARRNIDDEQYIEHLKNLLEYKYKNNQPDIIITSDDGALDFILSNGSTIFPNIPTVFSGVNIDKSEALKGQNNITGIYEGMAIEENLNLIRQVQPQVEQIIMLGDVTSLGGSMVTQARLIQKKWQQEDRLKHITLQVRDKFILTELYADSESLSTKTAFLILAIHKDQSGEYFSFEKQLPILSKHSASPIYGMWGGLMIGNGIVGGLINDPYLHGKNTAKIAIEILAGVSPATIPVKYSSTFLPKFDYLQLKRFELLGSPLPKNSTVINQPISVYEENKNIINITISLFVILFLVISLLIKNIRQKQSTQVQLSNLNQQLESKVNKRTLELIERNDALEEVNKQVERMAYTDVLTGIGNRRAANEEIESYISRSHSDNKPLSLAILDIDHFKHVNDTFGHLAGDDVLFRLAAAIKHDLRPSDQVYRWGGEEFILLLPDTAIESADAVCKRLRNTLNDCVHGQVGKVTVSIGVASLQHEDDLDSLITRCDVFLYTAKENGRDQVVSSLQGLAGP
jgi:diguanylate cyclase (GGDEF)-like protein